MNRGKFNTLLGTLLIAGSIGCYNSEDSTSPVFTKLEAKGGSGQSAPVSQPLPEPLRVQALDQNDQPVAGARVQWEVTAGGGRITPVSDTDEGGFAEAIFTMGTTPGPATARAFRTGVPAGATFTATATGGGGGGGNPVP